jgi:hypothetical protein
MYGALIWGIKLEIISYLALDEIYLLGCCDKLNFLIFLREKVARESPQVSPQKRFLGFGWKQESVCLASYPRCGNSFLRKLLENWSGTVTGSDSHPYRTLSKSLLRCGFKVPLSSPIFRFSYHLCQGEGITDRSVWFIKTHYPERHGYKKYPVDRALLLIRNPFDAIQSYFHMGMTNTHNQTLTPEVPPHPIPPDPSSDLNRTTHRSSHLSHRSGNHFSSMRSKSIVSFIAGGFREFCRQTQHSR